jgi:Fur family zinc uptake transcriptional regulator
MSHAHDHSVCVNTAIRSAEQLCHSRGVQLTPIRKRTLELIWSNHKASKAYDLLDQLKPELDSAKPTTVYRALDFLLEQGLIHRVESLNAFVGCHCSATHHEQILLICSKCHEVEELPVDQSLSSLDLRLKELDFLAQHKTLEIHGLCQECQKT